MDQQTMAAFALFANVAKYKDLPEEDRDMFRASAYYMLHAAFVIFPIMTDEHLSSIPELLMESVIIYRNAWIDFVSKWRAVLNCFDYSRFVRMKNGTSLCMDDIEDDEMAALLANKAFESSLALSVLVRQDIADEILAGKRNKLAFGNLKSASDLFLMLNFTLTIKTTAATNNVEVINLIDLYIAEMEKQKAVRQREKISAAALVAVTNRAKNSVDYSEYSECSEDDADSTDSIDAADSIDSADDDLPSLVDGTINNYKHPTNVSRSANSATNSITLTDNMYTLLGDVIFTLCSPSFCIAMHDSAEMVEEHSMIFGDISHTRYPDNIGESAVKYLDFSVDVLTHIIVLFINEHVARIFDYKIREMKHNPEIARKNNFNIRLTAEDYLLAVREMFSSAYHKKYGDLDMDRDDMMQLLGIQIINENKELLMNTCRDLHAKLCKI